MLRLWKQLLSTGVIAASLLALLACLGQDFLSTAFLCRVPLAAACLVGLLALAPYWPLPAMFGGLVRLSLPRMVLALPSPDSSSSKPEPVMFSMPVSVSPSNRALQVVR